jgi:glycosyltransferase involved in cell wall biosynthesis
LRPEDLVPIAPAENAADFLFIGEMRDLKGVDVFIEALGLLEREGVPARGLVVGPATPENAERYRALANARVTANRVAFRPPMPAREAFAMARIVIVPSRAESLPYLVLEAAGAGMPLIATDVGGIPEIFEGEAERLVPPGDPAALAAAMRAALADPARMAAEAVLRRDRIAQKFSLSLAAGQIEAIYRAALEARYRLGDAGAAASAGRSR